MEATKTALLSLLNTMKLSYPANMRILNFMTLDELISEVTTETSYGLELIAAYDLVLQAA